MPSHCTVCNEPAYHRSYDVSYIEDDYYLTGYTYEEFLCSDCYGDLERKVQVYGYRITHLQEYIELEN